MVEEIIRRLSNLTGSQLGRLEEELRRERQRRASSAGGGQDAPQIHERTAPPVTEVLEYRPTPTRQRAKPENTWKLSRPP